MYFEYSSWLYNIPVISVQNTLWHLCAIIIVAVWNRADHYIFALSFVLYFFLA